MPFNSSEKCSLHKLSIPWTSVTRSPPWFLHGYALVLKPSVSRSASLLMHLGLFIFWLQMRLASLFNSRYLSLLTRIVVDHNVARYVVCFLSPPAQQSSSYQLFLLPFRKLIVSFVAVRRELKMPSHSCLIPIW